MRLGTKYRLLPEGSLVEIPKDLNLDTEELRWGKSDGWKPVLPHGRYIVERAIRSEVRLADADWMPSGHVTLHSAKHAYVVRGRGVAVLLAKFCR